MKYQLLFREMSHVSFYHYRKGQIALYFPDKNRKTVNIFQKECICKPYVLVLEYPWFNTADNIVANSPVLRAHTLPEVLRRKNGAHRSLHYTVYSEAVFCFKIIISMKPSLFF